MEDARAWSFERGLWTGDREQYEKLIDPECLMVLPEQHHVFASKQAIEAVQKTPRWTDVTFSEQQVVRPQEGLIVLAYKAEADRDEQSYTAFCTTTIRRLEHDEWRVIQHQQTVPLTA